MKKIIMLALALSVFVGAQTAKADESFSMLELTCEEFLSDTEGMPYAVFWMSGYLGAKTNDVVISGDGMVKFTEYVAGMCQERPQATLGEAINVMLQQ